MIVHIREGEDIPKDAKIIMAIPGKGVYVDISDEIKYQPVVDAAKKQDELVEGEKENSKKGKKRR